MKFSYVIIYVEAVIKTTDFYQKAFDLKLKFIHESNMYAEMESGAITLAFAQNEMLKINTGIEVPKGFRVASKLPFQRIAFKRCMKRQF